MSSALQAKKRKEAEENLKQAEKSIAKTMLRWAPDYLAAAPYFEKAADAFRAAGDLDAAKRVFTQAAGVQVKNKSSFRAAQNYENVAKVVVQQMRDSRANGDTKLALLAEIKAAYDAASGHYGDMGELGKAADALMKSAACCEENGMTDVKQLRELYTRACTLMEAQDKPHFAVEPFRKTLGFLVKNAMYQDALALVERLIAIFKQIDQHANVYKCYLSEIIIILTIGDVALADKTYMRQLQEDAYLSSDECALAEDLVRAYKMGNEELLQTTIRKQGFSFLDNQISRVSRKLTIYGGATPAPTSASRTASGSRMQSQQQQQQRPQQPARAAPAPPAPAQKRAPAAPVVAPPAPNHEYETEATEDYNFNNLAARATVAIGADAHGTSAFDFESLEFAMPSESEFDLHHSTATESSYAPEPPAAQPASRPLQQHQQAPPPAMDDDMFDLT